MNLVDEQDGAAAHAAQALGIGHYRFDLLDAAQYRSERNVLAPRQARDQLGERRLADARRTPENDRRQLIALDLASQRFVGAENMLLPDVVLQARGAHPLGQRAFAVSAFRFGGRAGIEQAHRCDLWRRASYSRMPAALAALSDSRSEEGRGGEECRMPG